MGQCHRMYDISNSVVVIKAAKIIAVLTINHRYFRTFDIYIT